MRMVKKTTAILALFTAMVANTVLFAAEETVASATSEQVAVDTEACADASATIALGEASDVVNVAYSARAWDAAAAMGSCSLYDNGVLVASFDGEGEYTWSPSYGTHELSLSVEGGETLQRRFFKDYPAEFVVASSSSPISMDTRAGEGTLEAKEKERIVWSGLWSADANATATITLNGAPFASGKGEGVAEWVPTTSGTYTFRHVTAGSGETLTATFNVDAKTAEAAKIQEKFDGKPVTIESDGNGGWKVTLTDDISQTVQLSDDLGEVELDLNGHFITGSIDSAGIKIVHGAGTGTHLKIVDSQQTGTAMVRGGGCYYSEGVRVVADAANVLISVGEGVTIRGGDGLDREDLKGGDGAAGITGNVWKNYGTISGGNGGAGGDECGNGGAGVAGDVGENFGMIFGGDGGDDYYGGFDRGHGGVGVSGNVGANSGTISGGAGGVGSDGVGVSGDMWIDVGAVTGMVSGVVGNRCESIGVDLTGNELMEAALRNGNATNLVYDGVAHGISVPAYPQLESSVKYALDRTGPYSSATPQFTMPTNVAVWYVHSSAMYTPAVTNVAMLSIASRSISLDMVSAIPDQEYTGAAIEPHPEVGIAGLALEEGRDYSLSWGSNTNAGLAYVTVSGLGNCVGSTTREFSIVRATNAWVSLPSIAGWVHGQLPSMPNMGAAKFGEATVTYGAFGAAQPTEPGDYVAVFSVEGTANWTGLTEEVPFTISRTDEESKLADAFGGKPVAIEPDGNGGWKVTITNDIDSADLPIELPDNIGPVTIDLNGHDLVGPDGEPAIRIVPGGGDGAPTQLTIVNTEGGTVTVQGGEGSPAIVVADGTQDGVIVNIGEGVVVRSGVKPEIRNVTAKQRYPWNGLVDITCEVSGIDGTGDGFRFALAAVDTDSGTTNEVLHFWVLRDGTNSTDCAVNTNGDYRFVWDARAEFGTVIYSNMVVCVAIGNEDARQKVQLWEGGPYWATTNIGAEKPEDYGYYFWWGDTVGYKRENGRWVASDGSSSNFAFGSSTTPTYGKDIATLQSEEWITADEVLVPAHDAAHVHWGGKWYMPTRQELVDLVNKCDWQWVAKNNVHGYLVKGKDDYSSNSIFLPCAGIGDGTSLDYSDLYSNYWSSVPLSDYYYSWRLYFYSSVRNTYYLDRYYGQSVRPVQRFAGSAVIIVQVGGSVPFLLDTMDGTRESEGIETFTYSSLWDGDANATVTVAQDGVVLAEGLIGEGELAWNVTRNGTYVLTHTTYTNGVAGNVETATFVVTGKDKPFADSDVVVTGYSGEYDGAVHGINAIVADGIVGAVVRYAAGDGAPVLPWAVVSPTLTDVGSTTVWCEISAPGYVTQTNSATIRITQATNEWFTAPSMACWTYSQTPSEPDMGEAKFGTATVAYFGAGGALGSALPAEPGDYVAVFAVAETVNWSGLTKEVPFKITAAEEAKLEDAFEGLPVTLEPDGEGGWIVTITNDIDVADLPIEIPDNVGNVTIDLNGHDLIGGDGRDGARPSQDAGEDGKPAIVIVRGEGDGEPTVITIVNSGEDAIVQGGEGGAGNPAGNGAPAIEVADGAQDGVLVNIGEGVTVQGGDEYTPAIVGNVGTNEGTIVEPTRIHIPGYGSVTTPKSWKVGQKVTWKATAAKGSVFAHWEGAFVKLLNLTKNERRNPSLAFVVPVGFDTNGISAVFISVDDDRLGTLALSQPGPLAPNADVAGLSLVDDSESYVTASMGGLPTGLKFDAKTLAITGKPTKPGVYTVKVTAKNASGYQWAENIALRVADIADARIDFGGLPETGSVGEPFAGRIAAGEFKSLSASGWPSGVKFDAKSGAVAGIPTKGGYFTVTVTATYADKSKATATRLLTISPAATAEPKRTAYHPLTVVPANAAGGTATGTGVYAEGKKVSISAKPAKGYVFAGWYRDPDLTEPMAFAADDWRKASQSVVVPEVRYLFARFVTERDDGNNIALAVDGVEMAAGAGHLPYQTNVMCGVYMEWPVAVETLSLPKVAVAGLPAGLKFTEKPVTSKIGSGKTAVVVTNVPAYTIYGAPTAASKTDAKTGAVKPSVVNVTVTTASKAKVVYEIDVTVDALPEWAVGTFDGCVWSYPSGLAATSPASGEELSGAVTMTVAANGKISGKLLEGGQTWTLSAAAFDRVEDVEGSAVFYATVVGKAGKEIVTNEVTVAAADGVGVVSGMMETETSRAWSAWQNLWKRADTKADMPVIKKDIKVDHWLGEEGDTDNKVTLTFKKDGVVAFAGMVGGNKVSGSSQLVDDGKGWKVTLYAPPKGAFTGFCVMLPVTLTTDANIVTGVAVK